MNPLYKKVAESLKHTIIEYLDLGIDQLPPERELCKTYQVSRQTIRDALKILEDESLIKKIHGKGNILTGIVPFSNKNTVAVVISNNTEYIYPLFTSLIKNALINEGFNCSFILTNNKFEKERTALLNILNSNLYVGIIIEPVLSALPSSNSDVYEKINKANIPVIFINNIYFNLPNLPCIKHDDFHNGELLCEYAIGKAHTDIAAILQIDTIQGHDRFLGIAEALNKHSLSLISDNVYWYNIHQLNQLQKKQDTRFLVDFIKTRLDSCSCIICQNDEIAYYLCKELSYINVNVPEDVSILCFDNSYLSELSSTKVTSLNIDLNIYAHEIVSQLINLIKNRPFIASSFTWQIIDKGSCISMN